MPARHVTQAQVTNLLSHTAHIFQSFPSAQYLLVL